MFLDSVLKDGSQPVSPLVANTLLELLLRDWADVHRRMRQPRAAGSAGGGDPAADGIAGGADPLHDPLLGMGVVGSGAAASSPPPPAPAAPLAKQPQDMEMVHKLKTREDAVMHLLRNDRATYDSYHALVLVQVADFKLGVRTTPSTAPPHPHPHPAPSKRLCSNTSCTTGWLKTRPPPIWAAS